MTKIERFEDIEAWKKARSLVKEVYRATGQDRFFKDFGLRDQIRRASVSIISNIAEGFSRQTDQEFIHFLYIVHPVEYLDRILFHRAGGSTSEVQSQLYVALDLDYINREEFERVYDEADQVARLISGFIKYLKGIDS